MVLDSSGELARKHALVCYQPVAYGRRIETRIRAVSATLPTLQPMNHSEPARTAARRARSLAPSSSSTVPKTGITVFSCEQDEAVLFQEMAPRFGIVPTIIEAPTSEANAELASGNRCISIGHKTRVTNATL